jgi:acetate CoA/acetoacetate CoA-transferase beta subunit
MDLVVGAKKVIIAMEHTAKGRPKILKKCTLPLTAVRCVNFIVTEMCVMEVTPDRLVMTEINPEFGVEDVRNATEAEFTVPSSLAYMKQ